MNLLASSNVISVLLLHAVVRQHHCHAEQPESASSNDISFKGPDLVVTMRLRGGTSGIPLTYLLKAYPSVVNKGILEKNYTSLKSALRWYSIGHPVPHLLPDEIDPNKTTIVQMGRRAFHIYFDMLTPEHINLLKKSAKKKYHIDIDDGQIIPVPLVNFRCSFSLYDRHHEQYMFKGKVENFDSFPLQLIFPLSPGSKKDMVFKKQLPSLDYSNWPMIRCSMAANGKKVMTNTLTITSNQIDQVGMKEKLFGDASGGQQEKVYVTRDQMTEFSREMYDTLNIIEEYDMPESQFSDAFVNGLIQQASASKFKDVPIDDALASLSKYRVDVAADLRPDEIKKELSNILKVEDVGDKKRIVSGKNSATEREKAAGQRGSKSESATNSQSNSKDQSTSGSNAETESAQTSDVKSEGNKKSTESRDSSDVSSGTSEQTSNSQMTDQASVAQTANSDAGSTASSTYDSNSQSQGSSHFSSNSESSGGNVGLISGYKSTSNSNGGSQQSASSNTHAGTNSQSHARSNEALQATKNKKSSSASNASTDQRRRAEEKENKEASDVHKSSDRKDAHATSRDSSHARSSALKNTLQSGINRAEDFAENNQARTVDKLESLNDQLNELNRKCVNNMQWEFQGNKVIPKSINVARMARGNFKKTLNFNRVKIQKIQAEFSLEVAISTARLRLKVSPDALMKLSDRVDTLEAQYNNITSDIVGIMSYVGG